MQSRTEQWAHRWLVLESRAVPPNATTPSLRPCFPSPVLSAWVLWHTDGPIEGLERLQRRLSVSVGGGRSEQMSQR